MESFKVTNLDISNITEEMLEDQFVSRIREPGIYNLQVTGYKMGVKKQPDGAGKKWGWLSINAEEVGTGNTITSVIDVPLESLTFTSKEGKATPVKSKIFVGFLKSIGLVDVKMTDIGEHVNNLTNLLDANPTFRASLGFQDPHVSYHGKIDGVKQYGITMRDGTRMLDADGVDQLVFPSFKEAAEYYESVTTYKPAELSFKSFLKPAVEGKAVAS